MSNTKTVTTDKFSIWLSTSNALQDKKGIWDSWHAFNDVKAIVPFDLSKEDITFILKGKETTAEDIASDFVSQLKRLTILQACKLNKDFAASQIFYGSNSTALSTYETYQALKKEFGDETPT